ncbi:helix-turn-helix domain-containing protein [Mycoplasmatota bacterium]|nr:helix-turn-helix domain-containing protein [Mycoplasmatota bacterium]
MAIKINLSNTLKKRGITSKELAKLIGITEANLSILRSGKAKAIRFETLNAICIALNCTITDVIEFENEE